jgi:hypothetical protein
MRNKGVFCRAVACPGYRVAQDEDAVKLLVFGLQKLLFPRPHSTLPYARAIVGIYVMDIDLNRRGGHSCKN